MIADAVPERNLGRCSTFRGVQASVGNMDIRDQYSYLRPQPRVWFAIIGSAVFHAGLVLLLIVGGLIRQGTADTRDRAKITALLRKGKPRPDDWLPRKLPAPAPAPPKEVRPDPKAESQLPTQLKGYPVVVRIVGRIKAQ